MAINSGNQIAVEMLNISKNPDDKVTDTDALIEVESSSSDSEAYVGIELSEEPTCRICFRGRSSTSLLAPCLCKGTMAHVHQNCLERWLMAKETEICDICKFKYIVKRSKNSCWRWFIDPSAKKDRRTLLGYIIWAIITTPFVVQLVWNCFEKSDAYAKVPGYFWNATALSSVAMFATLVHVTWIGLAFRKCYEKFKTWKEKSINIRIINCPPRIEKCSNLNQNRNIQEQKPVCSSWIVNVNPLQKSSSFDESFPLLKIPTSPEKQSRILSSKESDENSE